MKVSIPLPGFVTNTEGPAIKRRQETLGIAGKITYGDGFGATDTTAFCLTYDPDPDGWNACPIASFKELQR